MHMTNSDNNIGKDIKKNLQGPFLLEFYVCYKLHLLIAVDTIFSEFGSVK